MTKAHALPAALAPLAASPRWVRWRHELRHGKATKVPYRDKRRRASTDDPGTWSTLEELPPGDRFDGIGLVLGDGLQGVDLDACIDSDGALEPWAEEVVALLDSYTEVSPSGRGLKVFFYGPPGPSAQVSMGEPVEIAPGQHKRREVAYYTRGRYFTVTGQEWPDRPLPRIDGDTAAGQDCRGRPLRQLDVAKAGVLRETIERHRQGNKRPPRPQSHEQTPPAAAAATRLPAALLHLIRHGAPEGQRSEQFHHAVRWCADRGLAEDAIVALLEQHPEGIASKYVGRVPAEVARCLQGYAPKTPRSTRAPGAAAASSPPAAADRQVTPGSTAGPSTPPVAIDYTNPLPAANAIVAARFTTAERLRTLHYWQGEFWVWTGAHYAVLPNADVREMLYAAGEASAKPIKKRQVDDVLDALKAVVNLSHRTVPQTPAWIDRQPEDADPRTLIPVANGLVQVDSMNLTPPTPRLFAPYALPFEFAPDPPAPLHWFAFLASVWRDEPDSVEALQEWFGYLLTADTALQKGLMIVGPRRSGKGTIGRVLVRLLGERNVCSPTLGSLGSNFGLEPLIGKLLALLSDARLGGRADVAALTENLLRITGEDIVNIDRKFQPAYTARLLTRVVVFSNEVPLFRDAASALPSRFVILKTTRSFLGEEDHGLDAKLAAELPGIMLWALQGLRRLRARGRFLQPSGGATQLRLMEDLASPIGAFLRDQCVFEPGAQVPVAKLYAAWRDWCHEHGREQPGNEQTFGRDIAAAAPAVGQSRPRIEGQRVRMYEGVRLRNPDDPEPDDEADTA